MTFFRYPNKNFNPAIKYTSLHYACVYGGRDHKNRSTGVRQTKTYRQQCACTLKLKATTDGQRLQVAAFEPTHNHDISPTIHAHHPSQRKIDQDVREEVIQMLSVNANRKLVQQHLTEKTGKRVILKDIHNIGTLEKKAIASSNQSNLQAISDYLISQPNINTEYVINEGDNMRTGIFIQDTEMQKMFDKFPEVILVDATHKTNNLDLPFYSIVIIDGNGETEIVAAMLVAQEDEDSIRNMFRLFKQKNPKWSSIQVVMTDKDMTERKVIASEIPNAKLQICLFHVLRTFGREITPAKMGITAAQKTTVLEIIQQMAYATSEEAYTERYEELEATGLDKVMGYFNTNWHNIKSEWVEGLKAEAMTLSVRTNNRIESSFQKLKGMVKRSMSLLEFIKTFLAFVDSM